MTRHIPEHSGSTRPKYSISYFTILIFLGFATLLLVNQFKMTRVETLLKEFRKNYNYAGSVTSQYSNVYYYPNKDVFRYDMIMDTVMRDAIKASLLQFQAKHKNTEQHVYVTFDTKYDNVLIPNYLRTKYPDLITIVMQYDFSDLKIADDSFSVTLHFNKVPEKIVVPYKAITEYHDPEVGFRITLEPPANGTIGQLDKDQR